MREDLGERFEQMLRSFRQIRQQLDEVAEQGRTAGGSAASADGLVSVSVGPGGVISELSIQQRAMQRYDAATLSATIRSTIAAATADLNAKLVARYQSVLGSSFDPEAIIRGDGDAESMLRNVSRHLYGR